MKTEKRLTPITLLILLSLALAAWSAPVFSQDDNAPADAADQPEAAETAPESEGETAADPPADPEAGAELDLRSYALGAQLAQSVVSVYAGVDVNYDDFVRGFTDELAADGGGDMQLAPFEIAEYVEEVRSELRGDKVGLQNLLQSREFLQQNRQREDVQMLDSGLQYIVLEEGEGESPSPEDFVRVHYRGTLTDGTEFDSSIGGDPAEFPVGGVIQGWQQALVRMKPGGKWKLFIPPYLAYGRQGSGGAIGPNEALIFEVELLEVLGDQGQGPQ